jgi:hypothetical protein
VAWATVIEKDFDVPFIADFALREKQIQQNDHVYGAIAPNSRPGLASFFRPGAQRLTGLLTGKATGSIVKP